MLASIPALILLLSALLIDTSYSAPATVPATVSTLKGSGGYNDFNCKSATQPYPVVILHGLGANNVFNIAGLQAFLVARGFCTFSITYGAYPQYPAQGGFIHIPVSSKGVSDYINLVASKTGASKVDLVGHSEGGFMTLYVPKFYPSTRALVRKSFAIAPPTHGTTLGGIVTAGRGLAGPKKFAEIFAKSGCDACNDLFTGSQVVKDLEKGGITQQGIKYTILVSKYDEAVTPVPTSSFVNEPGVRNFYVQDVCPADPIGHINEPEDPNIWNLVLNELQDQPDRKFVCTAGPPTRRDAVEI